MFDFYNSNTASHRYVLGFELDGFIYAVDTHCDDVREIAKLDKASRGQGESLRFKPCRTWKVEHRAVAVVLGSADEFASAVANSKYNKGEIFEKWVTEHIFGQVWEKDNLPFWLGGDIVDNGENIQVKYQLATFTNTATMRRFERA